MFYLLFLSDSVFNDSFDFQGLVALLGAVDALSRVEGFSNLKKQVLVNKYNHHGLSKTHQCAM